MSLGIHWGHVAILLPVRGYSFAGQPFYDPLRPGDSTALLQAVEDLHEWETVEVQWWSPLHVSRLGPGGPKGVVAMPVAPPSPLLQVAARGVLSGP